MQNSKKEQYRKELKEKANEKGVPERTADALIRYVVDGIKPGSFLRAVLKGDLFESFGRADSENRESLYNTAMFIYNDIPYKSWGNEEKIENWTEKIRE